MAIKKCNCKHLDQDRRYGLGNRVHNKARSNSGRGVDYICTVCEKRKIK